MNKKLFHQCHVWFYVLFVPMAFYFGYAVSGGDVRPLNDGIYYVYPAMISYWILMPGCHTTRFTCHSIYHLFAFESALIMGMAVDNHLDEMAGMLLLIAPLCVFAVVMIGVILLLLAGSFRTLSATNKLPGESIKWWLLVVISLFIITSIYILH